MDVRLTDGKIRAKATLLNERLKRCQGNWEDAFFITLARNFGFGAERRRFRNLGSSASLPGGRQTSERPFPDRSHLLWTSRHSGRF